ncbi:hypothetical protein FPZ12_023495 [Amycolatopsis acidicola]|uniref:Uncharacterized protein n=1 Tax=Amycolatopsis acidicola TaxID=2596893 RepID=A0A5N0UYR3_9PSEU|nr:hypothetical protein [Amycolatopsis acidicola]KAA9158074.1 hypothetical protein FPZ12_023495 [Amycolatopsis acidicola]
MRGIKNLLFVLFVAVLASTAGTASAGEETYDQFSLLYQKSAGQLVDGAGTPASQWAWNPGDDGTSVIRWDAPSHWNNPGDGLEHFVRDGDWLYLDGYENQSTGTYNVQRVTSEQIGDVNCAGLTDLPGHGGQQHYVRWTVPAQGYCLVAQGTITTPAGVVTFKHQQVWYPAGDCQTRFFGTVRCVQQHEQWWDDNGHPFSLRIERSVFLGEGLGMGLSIHSTVGDGVPIDWTADLKNVWTWG